MELTTSHGVLLSAMETYRKRQSGIASSAVRGIGAATKRLSQASGAHCRRCRSPPACPERRF
jgi:hypothetical protein